MTTKHFVFEVPYTKPEEVEVTFPIYGEHDVSGELDSTIYYYRVDLVDDQIRRTSVKVVERYGRPGAMSYGFKVELGYRFDPRSLDYELGRGGHRSNKRAFDEKLAEALAYVNALRDPTCDASAT